MQQLTGSTGPRLPHQPSPDEWNQYKGNIRQICLEKAKNEDLAPDFIKELHRCADDLKTLLDMLTKEAKIDLNELSLPVNPWEKHKNTAARSDAASIISAVSSSIISSTAPLLNKMENNSVSSFELSA